MHPGRLRGSSDPLRRSARLDVLNCARNKLTIWRDDRFTVNKSAGIEQRKKRVNEMITKGFIGRGETGSVGMRASP